MSPAEVVLNYLKTVSGLLAGYGSAVQSVPPTPDLFVTITDFDGHTNGRLLRTGEHVTHPGIQVRVRTRDFPTAHDKTIEILRALEAVKGVAVAGRNSTTYRFDSFTMTSLPTMILIEEQARRHTFVLNGTVTLKDV